LRTGSAVGALSLACVVFLSGCTASSFYRNGTAWRHRDAEVVAPDLMREGWKRVRVPETDLAFRKNGEGVIAMRVSCNGQPRSLLGAGRDLWLGIPRQQLLVRELEVNGRPAVETIGVADGTEVRAVVVETDGCVLDVAHVRVEDEPDSGVLERFLDKLRFGEQP
jgi:hypothetical protein